MSETFSLSEVFRMAEEIEKNGVEFYTRAAELVQDDQAKNVMLDLAEKEKAHADLFRKMREMHCDKEDIHMVDIDGHVESYIKATADNHVFNMERSVAKLLGSIQSPASAVRMALGFEKDSIVFFSAMKNTVTPDNRDKVEWLINEELDHIAELSQTLENL